MENLDITLINVLEEYDKYVLSSLIKRPYDFYFIISPTLDFICSNSDFNVDIVAEL